MVKIVLFNGKNSYRLVDNDVNTILVPDTQQNEPESIVSTSESDELNIEENLAELLNPISNSEMIFALE